jgi:flagellar basal-body rod protein FlgF
MPYGIYMSAAGAEVQNQRLQVLSNNLANVDTLGFKRELLSAQARQPAAVERGWISSPANSLHNVGGGVQVRESMTDFASGTFRLTERHTDLAIEPADGFFVIERDGRELLTRAGDLSFDAEGVLRTQHGDLVLGLDGPIAIDPQLPFRFTDSGLVQQGADAVGQLRVERPAELADLARVGENLFLPLADTEVVPPEQLKVLAGYLETSGVRPASEMVQLIEASRAYEANVRMIQTQDHALGELIQRVLRQV